LSWVTRVFRSRSQGGLVDELGELVFVEKANPAGRDFASLYTGI
jgi:hypothetical protein